MKKQTTDVVKVSLGNRIQDFAKQKPAAFICLIFITIVFFFWVLLCLPFSSRTGGWVNPEIAFFTTNSAISGTGFTVVPTGTFWSPCGKIIIMVIMQMGGLGIMTLASMLGFLVSKHLGLTTRILTTSDVRGSKFGEVGQLVKTVFLMTIGIEFVLFVLMLPKFLELYSSVFEAVGHSAFFAISSFNNVGLISSPGDISMFATHVSVLFPMILGITLGSLGFPVLRNLLECAKKRSFKHLTVHSKLVLVVYFAMDAILLIWFFAFEMHNMSLLPGVVNSDPTIHNVDLAFTSITARASGFSLADASTLKNSTLLLIEIWTFIGGGPASTVAGIKVTTFAIVLLAVVSELKGKSEISVFKKRLPATTLRVAITVIMCSFITVIFFAIVFSYLSDLPFKFILFDTVSAFANCGMSLGMPATLNTFGQAILSILMLLGRLGPMTIAAALMKREHIDLVNYPQENLTVG